MEWLLTPIADRVPSTRLKLCEELGINDATGRRWAAKPAFKKEHARRVQELQGSPERTQALLDALYDKALGGDVRAANLYLQATHRLTPPPTVEETTAKAMSDLNDEELDELISQAAKREQQRRQDSSKDVTVTDGNVNLRVVG